MARRILTAIEYPTRKVFRVVMDDSIPEWVHPSDAGAAHTADTARGPTLNGGARGDLNPSLRPGIECHSCVSNHDIREVIFDREERDVEDPPGSGAIRRKTNLELAAEILVRLQEPAAPVTIAALQDTVI